MRGRTNLCLGTIEEDIGTLVKYDESKIKDGSDVVALEASESHFYGIVHSRGVLLVESVSFGEGGKNGTLVQNPHPELIDHDDA